jgi:hypothetical protein
LEAGTSTLEVRAWKVRTSKRLRRGRREHHGDHILVRERANRLGIERLAFDVRRRLVQAERVSRAVELREMLDRKKISTFAEASRLDDQISDAPCRRFYDDAVDIAELLFVTRADFQVSEFAGRNFNVSGFEIAEIRSAVSSSTSVRSHAARESKQGATPCDVVQLEARRMPRMADAFYF